MVGYHPLRRIGRTLGLTRRRKEEFSDIVVGHCKILAKKTNQGSCDFLISLNGEVTVEYTSDSRVHESYNPYDEVIVKLRDTFRATYDYVGDDFSKRERISRERISRKVSGLILERFAVFGFIDGPSRGPGYL